MLCDKCGENMATFFESVSINGVGYETHLCSKCAGVLSSQSLLNFNNMDLFNFPNFDDLITEESKKCPTCSSTFSGFLKRGKLGCKDCYNTFEQEIRDMLENMESPIDLNLDEFNEPENDELVKLENDFKKAIEEERYEDAGKLKQEINKLKSANENKGDEK